jgi:hypothetical protein
MLDVLEGLLTAVAALRHDLQATGSSVEIVLSSTGDPPRYYLTLSDGRFWGGGTQLNGDDLIGAYWTTAEATQDLLSEVLGVVWPMCPIHATGLHVRPLEGERNLHMDLGYGQQRPAWWCNVSNGHLIATVGGLSAQVEGH